MNSHQSGDKVHEHHLHFKPLLGALQLLEEFFSKVWKKEDQRNTLIIQGLCDSPLTGPGGDNRTEEKTQVLGLHGIFNISL